MRGKSFGRAYGNCTIFFLCLLMCFTLGASPVFSTIEIDSLAVFSTDDMNYSFSNGYNLTGTLTLTSGRLDIDNYYIFNISATGGDCNISIIQMAPTTLEWNSSCQAGVTKIDNFLGNYTHDQKLYINGTYDSKKTPSNYFVYFAYLSPTQDNFILNLTSGIQINVIWKNGTAVMDFNFFATNGSSNISMVNSSPIIYEDTPFLLGVSNITVNKSYSLVDDYGNLQFYVSSNNSTINNTESGYNIQTLTLYTSYINIMGVELFWMLLFAMGFGFLLHAYWTKDHLHGVLSSILGTVMGLIIAIYSPTLTMLDISTLNIMFGMGVGLSAFGLLLIATNVFATYK